MIEEQELDHEIVIFPNPNRGAFDIELSGYVGNEAELQIFDLMRREILREKMNAQSNFTSSKVELLDAPDGHYDCNFQWSLYVRICDSINTVSSLMQKRKRSNQFLVNTSF